MDDTSIDNHTTQPVPSQIQISDSPSSFPTPAHPRAHFLSRKWAILLLVLIVFLFIGLGTKNIFFADKQQVSQDISIPTPHVIQTTPQQPQPSTVVQVSDTNEVNIYSDNVHGITFTYPLIWAYSSPETEPSNIQFKSLKEDIGDEAYIVAVNLFTNDYSSVVKKYPLLYSATPEQISTAGVSGLHYKNTEGGIFVVNRNGKALEIAYTVINGRDYSKEAQEILNSVVFTDDWKTYTDTYFKIRYPKSWKIQTEPDKKDIEVISIVQSQTENDGSPLGNSYQIRVMSNKTAKDSLTFAKDDISQNWTPTEEPTYSPYVLGNLDATLITNLSAGKGMWGPGVYITDKTKVVEIISENPILSSDKYFNAVVHTISLSN